MKFCEKVVWTPTPDEIIHAGLLLEPERKKTKGIVWVHGLYQNAFDNPGVLVGRHLAKNGYLFASGNNRGHDFGALLKREGKEPLGGGGGWEKFEDSDRDVDTWVNYVVKNYKVDEVVLAGHSFGALKAVYYMYKNKNQHVTAIVLLSTRIAGKEVDSRIKNVATKLVESGNGRDLIPWPEYGCSMSADTYLRHQDEKSLFRNLYVKNGPISEIDLPILIVNGGDEPEIDKRKLEFSDIQKFAIKSPSVDIRIIDKADHYYSEKELHVANAIIQWLKVI